MTYEFSPDKGITKRENDIIYPDPNSEKDPGAHYRYEYKGIKLDPARIAKIYGITNPMQFTALKKILAAGNRGHKDLQQDLNDIKCACDRWLELEEEDAQ